VSNTTDKYVVTRGSTPERVITLATGKYLLIALKPRDIIAPIHGFSDDAGGENWGATAQDLTHVGQLLDRATEGAAIAANRIPWSQGMAPFLPYVNTDAIKNATTGTVNIPTADDHPVLMQPLATKLSVSVLVPWDGAAILTTLSPADLFNDRGPTRFSTGADSNIHNYASFGHGALFPKHNLSASITPIDFIGAYGKVHMLGGASPTAHTEIVSSGSPFWEYCGRLDAVDAPGAAVGSTNYGIEPRDSMVHILQYGAAVIKNTGNTNINIAVHGLFTSAVVLQADTAASSISQFVSLIHDDAKIIQQHAFSPKFLTAPAATGTTKNESFLQKVKNMLGFGIDPKTTTMTHAETAGTAPKANHDVPGFWSRAGTLLLKTAEAILPRAAGLALDSYMGGNQTGGGGASTGSALSLLTGGQSGGGGASSSLLSLTGRSLAEEVD
jgi:uncharacterized membrane protein YgcG